MYQIILLKQQYLNCLKIKHKILLKQFITFQYLQIHVLNNLKLNSMGNWLKEKLKKKNKQKMNIKKILNKEKLSDMLK